MRQDISDIVASDLQCGRAIYRTLERFLDNEAYIDDDDDLADVFHGNYDDSIVVTSLILYTFGPTSEDPLVDYFRDTIERARFVMSVAANSPEYISQCYGGAQGFIDKAVQVHDLAEYLVPSPRNSSNRQWLVQRLNTIVGNFGPSIDLYCGMFGSCASQLNTEMSDLDISLEGTVDCGPQGWLDITKVSQSRNQNILRHVESVLRKHEEFEVNTIVYGRILVLKVFHRPMGIHCDICLSDDCTAWPKAQLFLCLNMIDEKFRLLVNLVMQWANEFGIKDASQGKLNSYTLTLLVIFHLQTRPDPVLPPLKSIMPGEKRGLQSWRRFEAARGGRSKAIKDMAWKTRMWAEKYGGQNSETLLELFISFVSLMDGLFQTWNHPSDQSASRLLRVSTYHSCVYLGEDPLKSYYSGEQHAQGVIFVEDPFDKEVNSGRAVCRACVNDVIHAVDTTLGSFQERLASQFIWDAFGLERDYDVSSVYSSD